MPSHEPLTVFVRSHSADPIRPCIEHAIAKSQFARLQVYCLLENPSKHIWRLKIFDGGTRAELEAVLRGLSGLTIFEKATGS